MGGTQLDTPLSETPGIPTGFLKKLQKLGLRTVHDLLWHFPVRYEDFSDVYKISDVAPGQLATIRGTVEDIEMRRAWRKNITIVEAVITDESGSIKAIWFNQPYILQTLKPGRVANLSGKVGMTNSDLYLRNPAYEFVDTKKKTTMHTARLVPVYSETRGFTSRGIRFLIQRVLGNSEDIEEWLPETILHERAFPEISAALHAIHFPDKIADAESARRRFAFENLFLLQLVNLRRKEKLAEAKAPTIKTYLEELKKMIAALPFELTFSQKRSLWEILKDMERPRPMNRLLQGDVGSGKTVVAALAAFVAARNGYQTAIMAPTEVLANQHFATLGKLLALLELPHKPAIGILTGSTAKVLYEADLHAEIKKDTLTRKIASGDIEIVVGTHSLISRKNKGSVTFKKIGLVVIDEQHRFGVRQRALLATGTEKNVPIPHFLSMSATPIPRTLMLTVFGDLDISLIEEMPAGRKRVITKIVPPHERNSAYEFIRSEVQAGRQAFVICPRILPPEENPEETEKNNSQYYRSPLFKKLEVKSATEEYEKLSKKIFPELSVALLHGQLKANEKNAIMNEFRKGKTDILVSTSVIEVGVDVPNATIMMIEGSERFGLAQIYQFRGRVGRGEHQSHCFLFTDSESSSTASRLEAIIEAKNGFELAERDLKLRGPGEFLGESQTGFPDSMMSGLKDLALVVGSRRDASALLTTDPKFKKHPLLAEKLDAFEKLIHLE